MTTWVAINDSQGATWDGAQTFGYLLLESGVGNFLIQETGTILNKFVINSSNPTTTWNTINDTQGAVWTPISTI